MLTSKTVAATPYAKKLAKDHGIDLSQMFTGSVIRGKDVEKIVAKKRRQLRWLLPSQRSWVWT